MAFVCLVPKDWLYRLHFSLFQSVQNPKLCVICCTVEVHFDALLHGHVDHAEGLCLRVDFLAAGDPPRSAAGHVARNREGADELQEPRGFAWGVLDSPKQKKLPVEGKVFISSCAIFLAELDFFVFSSHQCMLEMLLRVSLSSQPTRVLKSSEIARKAGPFVIPVAVTAT